MKDCKKRGNILRSTGKCTAWLMIAALLIGGIGDGVHAENLVDSDISSNVNIYNDDQLGDDFDGGNDSFDYEDDLGQDDMVLSTGEEMLSDGEMADLPSDDTIEDEEKVSVYYDSHVQTYGWLDEVCDGALSGTTGKSKRMEAVHIRVQSESLTGGIEYCTHVQSYGWLKWVENGVLSGTTGESKRLEALRIRLTGELAEKYDIYYRVHAQTYGWLGWAKNGCAAGTSGYSKRLEAYEVRIVRKGEEGPESKEEPYKSANGHKYTVLSSTGGDCVNDLVESLLCEDCGFETERVTQAPGHKYERKYLVKPSPEEPGIRSSTCTVCGDHYEEQVEYHEMHLTYDPYVEGYGWLGETSEGEIAGTFGESKRLEGIKISLDDGRESGLTYKVHMQTYGWESAVGNGEIAGNPGSGKRMEAIQLELTGPAAEDYDIYYCTHVQTYGWLGWAKNGERAGTAGLSKRIEAIRIQLVEKGDPAPGPTTEHFRNYTVAGSRSLSSWFGISRQQVVSYLQTHEHDSYYLGTPFPPKSVEAVYGQDYFNPKGDPGASGLARNPGTYMNCVGFVWHVLYKSGASYTKIPRLADSGPHHAWRGSGRSTWPSLWSSQNLKRYYFNNKTQLLESGILEKGDIIWCTSPSDCHILIFWGDDPHEDVAWHSLASGNKICCIHGANQYSGTWNVLKWE